MSYAAKTKNRYRLHFKQLSKSKQSKLLRAYSIAHGRIPKNHDIVAINGDITDWRPENLIAVPKLVLPALRQPISLWANHRETIRRSIQDLVECLS